jgi:hypothetical protein
MIPPMTEEEFAEELGKVVARARLVPPRFDRIAPPIDLERVRACRPGKLYDGFEEDVRRMRRGLEPLGPRE